MNEKRKIKIKMKMSLRNKINSNEMKNKRLSNLLKDGLRQRYEWITTDEI